MTQPRKRIIVKIGTQSILNQEGEIDTKMLGHLVEQIHALKQQNIDTVLVSSGAVGAGRPLWQNKIDQKNKITDQILEKQVMASIGQSALIHQYNQLLMPHNMIAAQLLLTRHDFRHRRHSVTIGKLLDHLLQQAHLLPIANENDSLAVEELMFTDNDELAGMLAAQIGADHLFLLTDVDGVLDMQNGRTLIPKITAGDINDDIDTTMTGGGRGGMQSKLATAKKMAEIGVTTHICRAREENNILRLMKGEKLGTIIPAEKKKSPVKRWLAAGVQNKRGKIIANPCLAERLLDKSQICSILPVGISKIDTPFEKEDVVEIYDENNTALGYGIARYGANELKDYLGENNQPIFIHYNALYIEKGV